MGTVGKTLRALRLYDDAECNSEAHWLLVKLCASGKFPADRPHEEQARWLHRIVKSALMRLLVARRKRPVTLSDDTARNEMTPDVELVRRAEHEAAIRELDEYRDAHQPGNFSKKQHHIQQAKRKRLYGTTERSPKRID